MRKFKYWLSEQTLNTLSICKIRLWDDRYMMQNSPAVSTSSSCPTTSSEAEDLPAQIRRGDAATRFAWDEFMHAKIRNPYTRRNYKFAVSRFLAWCDDRDVPLSRIAPRDVGVYLDNLAYAPATKKLHLAAIRHFFDQMVLRHVVVLNPAASVRADRLEVVEGKTPEITPKQIHALMDKIDIGNVVGLRDRAIIGVMIYTAARVGAIAKLRRGDFYDAGDQFCLRMTEKGTKSREIPVRHDLQQFLNSYVHAAALEYAEKDSPLFRTTIRRTKIITHNGMTATDMTRMVKRRLKDAKLPERLSPHSFRVATITNLLLQQVRLEDVQLLAGHASPRTTRLYDRRKRHVTRNIVERISL